LPETDVCSRCKQEYRTKDNGFQTHFMYDCLEVKNACQRVLNDYLSKQKVATNAINTQSFSLIDNEFEDLNSASDFSYHFNEVLPFESVPEVCVEIEIPTISQLSETISIAI
jgi:hypothetical protein